MPCGCRFATTYPGLVGNSVPEVSNLYFSTSFRDDLAWAAIWLYQATGDSSYLSVRKPGMVTNHLLLVDLGSLCHATREQVDLSMSCAELHAWRAELHVPSARL